MPRGIGFRCGTLDGHPLDPAEVAAAALIGRVRRVVVGCRRRRARHEPDPPVLHRTAPARRLPLREHLLLDGLPHPGSWCQADHLDAFNGPKRGSTNPGNGGPACGRHNRFKEHGFTVHRDERGRWHIFRPDGTEIV